MAIYLFREIIQEMASPISRCFVPVIRRGTEYIRTPSRSTSLLGVWQAIFQHRATTTATAETTSRCSVHQTRHGSSIAQPAEYIHSRSDSQVTSRSRTRSFINTQKGAVSSRPFLQNFFTSIAT